MFAIIDVETTGLTLAEDRIVEISVLLYDGNQVTDSFTTMINPQRHIPSHITKITGISDNDVVDAPYFYEVAKQLVEMTEQRIIVAHNVRFDYAFLRKEFQRLGYNFRRRQLCTLRLSRSLLPDLAAHNLNYLTRHLEIEMPVAHRAEADSIATLQVFRCLQKKHNIYGEMLEARLNESLLPPGVSKEQADKLPEETGVYLFYDDEGQLIYVGKSTNIRKRVLSHFANDIKSPRSRRLKENIFHISYEVTGSELVALLMESHLIKSENPRFNIAQRQGSQKYGLFVGRNRKNYLTLSIELYAESKKEPVIVFSKRRKAEEFLLRLCQNNGLCHRLCGLDNSRSACFQYHLKRCNGACIGEEPAASYNLRMTGALKKHHYRHTNFMIVDKGRKPGERSAIVVENGHYLGYAFLQGNGKRFSPADVKPLLECREENSDVRRIINAFVERDDSAEILTF